jgi:hypothetical protein
MMRYSRPPSDSFQSKSQIKSLSRDLKTGYGGEKNSKPKSDISARHKPGITRANEGNQITPMRWPDRNQISTSRRKPRLVKIERIESAFYKPTRREKFLVLSSTCVVRQCTARGTAAATDLLGRSLPCAPRRLDQGHELDYRNLSLSLKTTKDDRIIEPTSSLQSMGMPRAPCERRSSAVLHSKPQCHHRVWAARGHYFCSAKRSGGQSTPEDDYCRKLGFHIPSRMSCGFEVYTQRLIILTISRNALGNSIFNPQHRTHYRSTLLAY